jgi:hypothetical protein
MFITLLQTDSKFVHSAVAKTVYVVDKRPLKELCALLAICFQIDNSRMRWRCNLKGLSQQGEQAGFSKKTPRLTDDRQNESDFGRIHLCGEYL